MRATRSQPTAITEIESELGDAGEPPPETEPRRSVFPKRWCWVDASGHLCCGTIAELGLGVAEGRVRLVSPASPFGSNEWTTVAETLRRLADNASRAPENEDSM